MKPFLFALLLVLGAGDEVYKIGGGVSAPVVEWKVEPQFPDSRRGTGGGTVMLELVVNAEGRTEAPKIVRSLDSEFDQAALDAVKQWKFKPGMKDGKPVKVRANVEINFKEK